jgi:hypothetical protein
MGLEYNIRTSCRVLDIDIFFSCLCLYSKEQPHRQRLERYADSIKRLASDGHKFISIKCLRRRRQPSVDVDVARIRVRGSNQRRCYDVGHNHEHSLARGINHVLLRNRIVFSPFVERLQQLLEDIIESQGHASKTAIYYVSKAQHLRANSTFLTRKLYGHCCSISNRAVRARERIGLVRCYRAI